MGKDSSWKAVISSLALAMIILFYPLAIGSYFQPDVYRFQDRTTYHQYFEGRYIFDQLTDNIIIGLGLITWLAIAFRSYRIKGAFILFLALLVVVGSLLDSKILQYLSIISLPSVLVIYLINNRMDNKPFSGQPNQLIINYFLISILILAAISLFASLYDQPNFNNPFIDIMTLLSRFAPVLLVLVSFSFFIRMILKWIVSYVPKLKKLGLFSPGFVWAAEYNIIPSSKTIVALISAFMGLSILIVLIPHLNGEPDIVGEDTNVYSNLIRELKESEGLDDFLNTIFSRDRPISVVILYVILLLFNDNVLVAFEIFMPAVLAPLLVLSIYFLTRDLSRSPVIALFSSFITAISFQTMMGVYAGFYANWIALILGYTSLWFAVRFLDYQSKRYVILFALSLTALLFSHTYTWTIITAFLIIFLIVLKWRKIYHFRQIGILLIIVVCVVAIDLAKSAFLESASAVQRNVSMASSVDSNLFQLTERWSILVRTVEVHLGGIFANVIILSLVLYCILRIKLGSPIGLFCVVFLSLGIFTIFIGDKIIQSRVLYDIPFQIPAGIAMAHIFLTRNGKLISFAIGISLLAISFYTMTNLGSSPR